MGILYRKTTKFQEGGTVNEEDYTEVDTTTNTTAEIDDYNTLLDSVIKVKGGTAKDYERMMDQIGFHESKYIVKDQKTGKGHYKYLDPKSRQVGGGPGRGIFMFEEGKNAGGITAAKRTYQYMKAKGIKIPDWLNTTIQSDSLDASTLTKEQQRMLFLGNYMQHPKANMGNVISGKQTIADFWGTYHQTQNDPEKIKNFNNDVLLWLKRFRNGGIILKYQQGGNIRYTSDPRDKGLAMYNDSLNLYNSYIRQKALLPEARSDDFSRETYDKQSTKEKVKSFVSENIPVIKDVDKYISNMKSVAKMIEGGMDIRKAYDMYPGLGDLQSFKSPEDYLKGSIEADPYTPKKIINDNYNLSKYYETLKFAYPTSRGIYTSADLNHSSIKPIDTWLGEYGVNPVYKKPINKVIYNGKEPLPYDKANIPGYSSFNGLSKSKSKEPNYDTDLQAYLKREKMPYKYSDRAILAKEYGIKDYKGTATQNIDLLNKIKNKESKPTYTVENKDEPNTKPNSTNSSNKEVTPVSNRETSDKTKSKSIPKGDSVEYTQVITGYTQDPRTGKKVAVYENKGGRVRGNNVGLNTTTRFKGGGIILYKK